MNHQDPIAVCTFFLMVMLMFFSIGRNLGFNQGFEVADNRAFAEGHIAGLQDALLQAQPMEFTSIKP